MNEPNSETPNSETPKKKPYNKPRLLLYGDIRAVTQSVSTTGSNDGSGALMLKTR